MGSVVWEGCKGQLVGRGRGESGEEIDIDIAFLVIVSSFEFADGDADDRPASWLLLNMYFLSNFNEIMISLTTSYCS